MIVEIKSEDIKALIFRQGDNLNDLETYAPKPLKAKQMKECFMVDICVGLMSGKEGDYIVKGEDGTLFVMKKEIFEMSYQKI